MPKEKPAVIEKHRRVKDVAEQMGVSPQTVRRLFVDRPGVKVVGETVGTKRKRRYRTMLIPESLIERVMQELEINC